MSIDRGPRFPQIVSYDRIPKNLLINPGFEIWQRGTSFNSPVGSGTDIATADEWQLDDNVADASTVTQDTSNQLFGASCLKLVRTYNGGASCNIEHGVESYRSLEGRWLTGSMWIKASAGPAWLQLGDYDGTWEVVQTPCITDNQWHLITVSKKIRTGLQQFVSVPHSYGIMFYLSVGQGSGTYYLDGAVLVIGKFPEGVPFVPPDPAIDFKNCQRFYQTSGTGFAYGGLFFQGEVTNGRRYYAGTEFPTHMAATPTLTLTNDWNASFPASRVGSTVTSRDCGERRDANANGRGLFHSTWKAEVT